MDKQFLKQWAHLTVAMSLALTYSVKAHALNLTQVIRHTVETNPKVLLQEHIMQASNETVLQSSAGLAFRRFK